MMILNMKLNCGFMENYSYMKIDKIQKKKKLHRLDTSDKRWIDEEIGVVTDSILEFVSNI